MLTLRAGIGGARSHSAAEVARILRISAAREARIERSALITLREVAQNEGCAGAAAFSPRATVMFVVGVASTGLRQAVGAEQGFPPFSPGPAAPSLQYASAMHGGRSAGSTGQGRSGGHGGKTATGKSRSSAHSGSVDYAALHAPSSSGSSSLPIVLLLLLGAAGLAVLLGPDIRRAALRRRSALPAGAAAASSSTAPVAADEAVPGFAALPSAAEEDVLEPTLLPGAGEPQPPVAPRNPEASQNPEALRNSRPNRPGWLRHGSQAAMVLTSLGGALQLITRRRRGHQRRR